MPVHPNGIGESAPSRGAARRLRVREGAWDAPERVSGSEGGRAIRKGEVMLEFMYRIGSGCGLASLRNEGCCATYRDFQCVRGSFRLLGPRRAEMRRAPSKWQW